MEEVGFVVLPEICLRNEKCLRNVLSDSNTFICRQLHSCDIMQFLFKEAFTDVSPILT